MLHRGEVTERMLKRPTSRPLSAWRSRCLTLCLTHQRQRSFNTSDFTQCTRWRSTDGAWDQWTPSGCCARQQANAADSLTQKRRDVNFGSQYYQATWRRHQDQWNGRWWKIRTLPEDNANKPVTDWWKLMNDRNEIEDHRIFNIDWMPKTMNHLIDSWILMMTDGTELLTIAHWWSPKHRLMSVTGFVRSDGRKIDVYVKRPLLRVGDWVWFYFPCKLVGKFPKWQSFYTGPFLIVRLLYTINALI